MRRRQRNKNLFLFVRRWSSIVVRTKRKTSEQRKIGFFLCDRPFIYRKKIIQNMYTHIVSLNVNWKLPVLVNLMQRLLETDLSGFRGTPWCRGKYCWKRFLLTVLSNAIIRLNTSIALSVWGERLHFIESKNVARQTLQFWLLIRCNMEVNFAN